MVGEVCIFTKTLFMQAGLALKVKAMLWDIPENKRSELVNEIMTDPVYVFNHNEQLFIRALNSLKWYELTELISKENLVLLLTDSTIQKLFPVQRRTYYTNARRLLSKYSLPSSGQSA
jgi:hypothetical protein